MALQLGNPNTYRSANTSVDNALTFPGSPAHFEVGTAQPTAEYKSMKILKLNGEADAINVMAETAGWTMPTGDLTTMPVEIKKYGERAWAVYLSGELLCVAAYLKGARAVQALIESLQKELRRAAVQADFPIQTTAKTVAS